MPEGYRLLREDSDGTANLAAGAWRGTPDNFWQRCLRRAMNALGLRFWCHRTTGILLGDDGWCGWCQTYHDTGNRPAGWCDKCQTIHKKTGEQQ